MSRLTYRRPHLCSAHPYWRGNEPARQGGLVGWQGLLEAQMTGHGSGARGQIFENLPVRRSRTALPCFQKSLENLPL